MTEIGPEAPKGLAKFVCTRDIPEISRARVYQLDPPWIYKGWDGNDLARVIEYVIVSKTVPANAVGLETYIFAAQKNPDGTFDFDKENGMEELPGSQRGSGITFQEALEEAGFMLAEVRGS